LKKKIKKNRKFPWKMSYLGKTSSRMKRNSKSEQTNRNSKLELTTSTKNSLKTTLPLKTDKKVSMTSDPMELKKSRFRLNLRT